MLSNNIYLFIYVNKNNISAEMLLSLTIANKMYIIYVTMARVKIFFILYYRIIIIIRFMEKEYITIIL